uniref:DNA topoisomerase 2 n=1 Tax=Culicoides sonorensis TaxID=179676 RepID=A0A336LDC4_CULSO
MVQREITYVPGLYKIYDEILVNAADNKQRDKKMTTIKIDINQETNTISVYNNGEGIPVVMHQDEKMYVPTMIFGHLLTSSNYNDEEEKVTGGRNGYGAKLCNIFSEKFTVETANKKYKKCFKQVWGSNMTKTSEPKIKEFSGEDFTKVTFSPDLSKFKMTKLEDDIVALMCRRAYDVAASTRGVSVFLNGTKLPVKTFKDYIDLYIKDNNDDAGNPLKICYENVNERWEVAVTLSDRGFQQVSFVNSIATTKGGRHVDHVADALVKQLIEVLKKKNKGGINIKPFQVKNHLWIFINCLIVNPTFDSQTKENMTLQAKSFGSKCTLTEKFITQVSKCGVVESVLSWAKFKAQTDLAKTSGSKKSKIKGVPKLEDANDAGTKNSLNCTLILTEGDSAKTLAVSGLGVVGRDTYGVFPLRGKLLNVREATHKQILENAEINALIKIFGLQYKKKYLTMDDLKTLRYGKCMIMTDQDQDGSHIKGLLINFIHTNWPELLRLPFLEEFITPIVKASKKDVSLSFYSLPEFEEWKADTPNHNTYNIKYYKGLGTSTSAEAREYFEDMDRHRILFKYEGSSDDDAITMAFAKKSVDQRKEWLTKHMEEVKHRKLVGLPDLYLYKKDTKAISYSEFVNLELVLFSNSDNERSIPNLIDGLKPGQRKVMFTCFKRNDKREVKVAQLAGSVAEQSAYHHGEQSLCSTIVNLAQNYVGSNNINLLQPKGQFGTRLSGGKDSASPRYIFTMMSQLTRIIFNPLDDPLLQNQVEDNQKIEPVYYIPIIPMVLVNGTEGIGTGWSTKIPNHNPRDIIANLRRMINGDEPKPMQPWYKNFRGTVQHISDNRYVTIGNCAILDNNKLEISELPIGTWTQNYKENTLEPLLNGSEKVKPLISDYKEYNTDTTIRFVISFAPGEFDKLYAENGGFHRVFKLTSSLSLSTMHAFDANCCLKRYDSAIQILREFYPLRLEFYQKRKDYLEGQLQAECDKLSNQARFIVEKCDRTIVVENKKRKNIVDELLKRGYAPDPIAEWKKRVKADEEEEQEVVEDEGAEGEEDVKPGKAAKKTVDPEIAFQKLADVKKFNYLLGMSMWMLTEERKNELLKQRDQKLAELKILRSKSPSQLWLQDLDDLSKKLDEVEEAERLEDAGLSKKKKTVKKETGSGRMRTSTSKKKGGKDETKPSEDGMEIQYKVTEEMLKKFEKADAAKVGGAGRVKKEPKAAVKREPGANEDEFDEFDALVEAGEKPVKTEKGEKKPRVKKEPGEKKERAKKEPKSKDGTKQTKLNFGKAKGKKKKGSDDEISDLESGSDEFEARASPVVAPREKAGRRAAAAKKVNYSFMNDGEDSNESFGDSEPEMFDNRLEESVKQTNITLHDSDDDFEALRNESKASDDTPVKPKQRKLGPKMTDDDETPVKKPKTAKRPAKTLDSGSSEDEKPKKKPKGKKKKNYDSDDFDGSDDSDFAP